MTDQEKQKLLQLPEVMEEIKRHLWIESEKAGYDIGYQNAAEDWLNRFAPAWVEYHKPGGSNGKSSPAKKTAIVSRLVAQKKRSAKSYR